MSLEPATRALKWAADVANEGPSLLKSAPATPSLAELRAVSVEELRTHCDRLLVGKHAESGLDALHMLGVLDAWLPEVAGMVGFGEGDTRHKDVWKHTKQVVRQSVPRLAVRWGALLHDIGKPKTRTIAENGEVHFFGHSEVGAAMFRKRIGKRLGFEDELFDRIHYLILHHLRASQFDGSWTDSAVRRFYREMGDGLQDLLDLSRADITSKRAERRRRGLQQIHDLSVRIRALKEVDARVAPLPKGLGNALMQRFSLPASKQLGDIKKQLEADVEEGLLPAQKDMDFYVEWIAQNRERYGL